jgi:hypothetical protein
MLRPALERMCPSLSNLSPMGPRSSLAILDGDPVLFYGCGDGASCEPAGAA